MRRTSVRRLVRVVCWLLGGATLLSHSISWSQPPDFQEIFNDPALGNWDVNGEVRASGSVLTMHQGASISRQAASTDMRIEFFVSLEPTGDGGHFRMRYRADESGGYVLSIKENWFELARQNGTILGGKSLRTDTEFLYEKWLGVEVTVRGQSHTIRVNKGRVILEAIDTGSPLRGDSISFETDEEMEVHVSSLRMWYEFPDPALHSIVPDSIEVGTSVRLALHGDGLIEGLQCDIEGDDVGVGTTDWRTPTLMLAPIDVSPSAQAGPRDVILIDHNESFTFADMLTIIRRESPSPTVEMIYPVRIWQGSGPVPLRITGADFADGARAVINVSGISVGETHVVGPGNLYVDLDVGEHAETGSHLVTVVNPDGRSATSPQNLVIWVEGSRPSLRSVTPDILQAGAEEMLRVTGEDFGGDFDLSVIGGGVSLSDPRRTGSTHIAATADVALDAQPGLRLLQIEFEDSPTLLWHPITVVRPPPPFIERIHLGETTRGVPAPLSIGGGGFRSPVTVSFQPSSIQVTDVRVVDESLIEAMAMIDQDAPAGLYNLEVQNPDGQSTTGRIQIDTIEQPSQLQTVLVQEIEPDRIKRDSVAVSLVITGVNFHRNASVRIDPPLVQLGLPVYVDSTQLEVVVSAGSSTPLRSYTVVVQNPGGDSGVSPEPLFVMADDPPPIWEILGPLLGLTLGLALPRLRSGAFRKWAVKNAAEAQWERVAREEIPEATKVCQWTCQVSHEKKLSGCEVAALILSPHAVGKRRTPPEEVVEGEVIDELNETFSIRNLRDDEEQTRKRVAPIAEVLSQRIAKWCDRGTSPASVSLSAKLKDEVECEFKLFHCEASLEGPRWVEVKKWSRSVNLPGGRDLGVLRGPGANETDFAIRARSEIEDMLIDLARDARKRNLVASAVDRGKQFLE